MEKEYARLVSTAAWAATAVATLLLIVKLMAWWVTGSVSLLASLIDSFIDIAASVVNLIVVRYSLQPADREHAFGHGKAESLAALAQAMFITGSAVFLILNGIDRFFRPHQLQSPEYGVYVSIFALLATAGLVMFQKYVVKKTKSQAIAADSLHYQTDLYMNVAIMIALLLSWYGFSQADAIFAIGIGIYISLSAIRMVYQASQTLLDRKLPDSEIIQIRKICMDVEGVLGLHGVRTRMSGPIRFIQLHLELDDDMRLIEAHKISDTVELNLKRHFPGADVLVHHDPYSVIFDQEIEQKKRGW
ncbi:CDF family cation-efflux transporter FieF [Vibrio sp.]|uniref:Cation-efflux pump FieF n=1 Tax=Vibrio viridaestus TaxID=2487322 RepID=A0A3N9TC78_9VIBR|nr:CDF family cation-efflux transporter FieF [Vibrio viridaestus]MDC0610070.1 CDF family cation-efflux transporter FieF [Vibrio sp.]RQW61333.1 CDF family cation-efflux pump FieF [Vibrio viridaestus]